MILIDTHALLWMHEKQPKLSKRAADAIVRADRIMVSTYSFFEVATLARRGLIRLDTSVFDWMRDVLSDGRFQEAPLTRGAAASAGLLGETFPGDPADRLLYATARDLAIPLVTRDRRIKDFAMDTRDVKVIW